MFKRLVATLSLMVLLVSGSVYAAETKAEPKAEGDVGAYVCPSSNNGNQTDFNVFNWTDMFVVQTNSPRNVSISVTLNSGSTGALVRLKNVSTGATTSNLKFTSTGTKSIYVGCGDWIVQISADAWWWTQRTHGSISAYPQ